MGLIKALSDSVFSYIGDMWEDYIYCDSLSNDVLVEKGHKRSSGGAGTRDSDNVITDGSCIAVNAGQMLIVVENGQVVDFTAEQGGYQYLRGTEPSMFCGSLGGSLAISIEQIKKRLRFGGIPANDQRVYFVNIKEILDNRFGFGNIPYRDSEFNLTILLQGFGVYSFRLSNPMMFYENVCGNVSEQYGKATLAAQLRAELQNELLPVFGELANRGVHYDRLPQHTEDILEILKENLTRKWREERGIEIMTVSFSALIPDDESMDKIRDLQESRIYSGNRAMLGARVGAASANDMESAAEYPSGAVNGFMGMGMARSAANVDVAELMREPPVQQSVQNAADAWTCSCGMTNHMGFCPKCGSKKPDPKKCSSCGFVFPQELAEMMFCPKCGNKVSEQE